MISLVLHISVQAITSRGAADLHDLEYARVVCPWLGRPGSVQNGKRLILRAKSQCLSGAAKECNSDLISG